MDRSRNFCFTINNFSECQEHEVFALAELARYVVCGREVGECGTPHLQGFVAFVNKKSLTQVKELLPTAHIEPMRGTFQQAAEYCKKDNDFFESGELPLDAKERCANAANERWQAAKEGRFEDLAPEHIKVYEYIYSKFRKVPEILDGDIEHVWVYGPPGTGKSYLAREEHPGAYIKDASSIWWNEYQHEDVVIIDDFDKYHVKQGYYMKIWLDRYAFMAQTKGGQMKIRPRKIVVTSNYHPNDIWDDEITRAAIARRVKFVYRGEPYVPTLAPPPVGAPSPP